MNKLFKKDKFTFKIIQNAIKEIRENPFDSEFLKGTYDNKRKKRKGEYRIIYKIDSSGNPIIITILKIGHRKNIYKI